MPLITDRKKEEIAPWQETPNGHFLVTDVQTATVKQTLVSLAPDITRKLPEELKQQAHDNAGELDPEHQTTCRYNMVQNKRLFKKSINNLKGSAKGKVAYIVGNGPSLKKNGHLLKDVKDGIVIALNGATKTVKNPDYFMCLDFVAREHWVDCDLSKSVAILSAFVPPFIAEAKYKDKRWFTWTYGKSLAKDSKQFLKNFDTLQQGYCVTFSATHFAYYLGCDKIVYVGQDFALMDGYAHAEDTAKAQYNFAWNYVPACTIKGEIATTTDKFVMTRNLLTGLCYWLLKAGIRVINATEDGILKARIGEHQIEQVKLEKIINAFERKEAAHEVCGK